MKVYFKPDKKWWQFWKRGKYLKENKDYKIENGMITLNQYNAKGHYSIEYKVEY